MKKIILIIICILLVGCHRMEDSPTTVVENLYFSYQTLDSSVLKELDELVSKEEYMDTEEKQLYHSLLKKQYQNLSFKIVSEDIIDEMAVIETEIEVLDYASSMMRSKKFYLEHQEEFSDNIVNEKNVSSQKEYIDYMLSELKNVAQKMKYTITFTLRRNDSSWEIEKIHDLDIQKIHGLY